MISYKGKAFCTESMEGLCKNKDCYRYFSDQDHVDAIKWWGDNKYPISYANFRTGKCGFIPTDKSLFPDGIDKFK